MRNYILFGVALVVVAGCGGGGSNPPPDTPDYFTELGLSLRWPAAKTANPLKVFIALDSGTDRSAAVMAGARAWTTATGNLAHFEQTTNAAAADINVSFSDDVGNADSGQGVGTVKFNITPGNPTTDGIITEGIIKLKRGIDESLIVPVSTHEFGHTLGIVGRNAGNPSHSSFDGDIMFATVRASSSLSARDIATLAKLYKVSRLRQ